MEREFTIGKNGYGDPRFEVTVDDRGRVFLTERDPHSGMRGNRVMLTSEDLNALFAELNLK